MRGDIILTIYTVKEGDSIYSISRTFGVPPSRIITDNMLTLPGSLVPGQDIVILYPTRTHSVRGGETLYSIAEDFGVTLNELYRNNPMLDGSPTVFPGQVLNISYEAPPLGEITSLGYAYPFIDETVLRRTLPYLTYLSIFTYGITDDGELIEPQGGDSELVRIAKEYGTVPLMMLTSLNSEGYFSNELAARILGDEELQRKVVGNTARVMREKGYGGVDVDFEYVRPEVKEGYGRFIEKLQAELGEDFVVFVSLAPKNSPEQRGLLYEGHDYPVLGRVSDYVLLMTYEWGYTFGPPLAVSPIDQVRRVLDYGTSVIDPEKIQLGVPNYGYDWALPYVRGESRAKSLSNVEAVELARARGAKIRYDSEAEAPFFTYFDRPRTYDDAVEHVVWFENARSVDAMLRLVSEYGLRGASVWNIMKYFPSLWLVMNSLFKIRHG